MFLMFMKSCKKAKKNNYLLACHGFMPKMCLRQPGFRYSACEPFSKIRKECRNLKEQEILDTFIKIS